MGRATAKVDGTTIAAAETWETVEGNIYVTLRTTPSCCGLLLLPLAIQFPPESITDKSVFSDSNLKTKCAWKGTASYYNVTVNEDVLKDAAWYYAEPKDAAKNIKDHIAFCECITSASVG